MINIIFDSSTIVSGLVFIIFTVLVVIRKIYPTIAREKDLIIITFGYLYGFIIILNGWRLDPLLLIAQIINICIILFLLYEILNLRMAKTIDKLQKDNKKNR